MCGITGVIDFKNQTAARHIAAMTSVMGHRGPDDEGFTCFSLRDSKIINARGDDTASDLAHLPHIQTLQDNPSEVALAQRRLSIIDLSVAGHNPLSNSDGRLWITYNGEIYNYLELREELKNLGHVFKSDTDTEVILAAYDEWGVECLSHLNGMFAFALWDTHQQRLFCARDRFGIKPFHYFFQDGYFAFASEIKGLLANPQIPKCASPQAIYDYLVNGAIVSVEDTFFEGIHQLAGSHALTLNAAGHLHIWRYFDLDIESGFTGTNYDDRVAEFADLLTDAVRLRLRSDVAVGSSLSGGLDSSSVVTLANQLLQSESGVKREIIGEKQRVFCAVYDGEIFNEKSYMDTVIDHTGASAFFTRPSSQRLWDELPKLVWHQDEPFNSTAMFAQYCVMQLVRENGVTVLLDGQGGDEILAGYPFYYGYYLGQALRAGQVNRFIAEARGARQIANESWTSLAALTGWNLSPAWLRSLGWKLGGAKMLSHKPISPTLVNDSFRGQFHAEAKIKHNAYPTLAQKLYDDVFNTNLPTLLRYEDRNSMAFHIEARVPFLDYRLVQFAFKLSADAHIRNGWSKAILRDSMKGKLPESIRLRRDKEGYTTPHERWLQELTPQINGMFDGAVRSEAYLSSEAIMRLRSPEAGNIKGVWRLINLESWMRAFALE